MLDLLLAILHHLLVFALVAILATEIATIRPGISAGQIRRIGSIDASYGALAGLIIVIGFARVFLGAKGSEFFLTNPWFWAKIAAFLVVGLLSVPPTIRFISWRTRLKIDPNFLPGDDEVRATRRFLHWEAAVLVLVPIFAAAMVRPYAF
jgi:putative membrane protein